MKTIVLSMKWPSLIAKTEKLFINEEKSLVGSSPVVKWGRSRQRWVYNMVWVMFNKPLKVRKRAVNKLILWIPVCSQDDHHNYNRSPEQFASLAPFFDEDVDEALNGWVFWVVLIKCTDLQTILKSNLCNQNTC